MIGLPGGAPHHPLYTKKAMLIILMVTVVCTILLLLVFKNLVAEGSRVEQGIEDRDSPMWDPSVPVK